MNSHSHEWENWEVVQSILTFRRFCSREFSCSLECACNPQIDIHSASVVMRGHEQSGQKLELRLTQGKALPSDVSSHTVSKCPFWGLFCAMFYAFLCTFFCWWFLCLKLPPSIAFKCWLVLLSLRRLRYTFLRKHVFDKLCSGMSRHDFGFEFNMIKSTVYIKLGVFKQKHT